MKNKLFALFEKVDFWKNTLFEEKKKIYGKTFFFSNNRIFETKAGYTQTIIKKSLKETNRLKKSLKKTNRLFAN